MKYYEVKSYGKTYNVRIVASKYANNKTLALSLITEKGEPFANLTVNIKDSMIWADETTAFVDTNNCPWAEEFIAENKLGKYMGIRGASGFCTYPLYKFNLKKLKKVLDILHIT